MKTRTARREFMRLAAKGLGYAAVAPVIYESILNQFLQQAVAETVGDAPKVNGYNYISLTFPGAPPRWMFDLPLTPAGRTSSNFVEGGFGTVLETVNGVVRPTYQPKQFMVNGKKLFLAPVWGMNYGSMTFADLLPNTLFVRGMDMEINNHQLSAERQLAPIIGGASLNGVVADISTQPIPAIVDPGATAAPSFKSNSRLAVTQINYTENDTVNPVATILKAFVDFRTGRPVHSSSQQLLAEQALAHFEQMSQTRGVSSSALPKMYENAMQLIDEQIISLGSLWASTVAKYRNVMNEGLHPQKGSLPGIYDKVIEGKAIPSFKYSATDQRLVMPDIRDIIQAETKVAHLAENFAMTEILLEKASSTFILSFPNLSPLKFGSAQFTMPNDQHDLGNVISTMSNTIYWRAFLGCLTTFTQALKSNQQFDRTILHVCSEFSRTPKADASGADHAYMGSGATLISGMINGGKVIGNIQKADYNPSYTGTFGVAKPLDLGGLNRPIQVNDVALTITSMVSASNIVTNGRSLLKQSGDKWVVAKDEAENV